MTARASRRPRPPRPPPPPAPVRRSPDLCGGEPVFADSTIPVRTLLDHLRRGGEGFDAFLAQWPDLTPRQVVEVLAYALDELIRRERIPAGPPQASLLPRQDDRGVITNGGELTAALVVGRRVLCPACRKMTFRSWPEGWDSHAAHRCSGVTATSAPARKAEFKRRYGHLFRS